MRPPTPSSGSKQKLGEEKIKITQFCPQKHTKSAENKGTNHLKIDISINREQIRHLMKIVATIWIDHEFKKHKKTKAQIHNIKTYLDLI